MLNMKRPWQALVGGDAIICSYIQYARTVQSILDIDSDTFSILFFRFCNSSLSLCCCSISSPSMNSRSYEESAKQNPHKRNDCRSELQRFYFR